MQSSPEKRQAFAKACNMIALVGSPEVITSLENFRESTHPETANDHDQIGVAVGAGTYINLVRDGFALIAVQLYTKVAFFDLAV